MYTRPRDQNDNLRLDVVIRNSDGAWIPTDPDNSDWAIVLDFLNANNETLADMPETFDIE